MTIATQTVIKHYGKHYVDHAILFRSLADTIDDQPDVIFDYVDQQPVSDLYTLRTLDAERFFKLYEASAYGDVGVLFACPRTCLSGILLQIIGNQSQQDDYFDYVSTQTARTFFATTEVNFGSDVSHIETQFIQEKSKDSIAITGKKLLVGNLGIANIGIIIGRVGTSPLGLTAALIKPADFTNNIDRVDRQTLPMFGIKPALLGKAVFKQFMIPANQLLGQQIHPMQRGLSAIVNTFNIMRLAIAGLALGHAQAMLDYIYTTRARINTHESTRLSIWQSTLSAIRKKALIAANYHNKIGVNTANISLVKVQSSQLVEAIAMHAHEFYGEAFLYEHPYLLKSLRDCFAYEYMDGTSNIQRNNIYQGFAHVRC